MNDLQLANLSISDVPRTRPPKLMDLPEEVRLMIYRYAFHRELVKRSFPALLSVSSQIRKEATPIFYRESRFVLELQPQPDTRSTVLNFNGKTREWFALIGSDNINDLRHVAFSFPGTRKYYQPYNEYQVDLACRDTGNWRYTYHPGPNNHFYTLERDLEEAENDTNKEEVAKFLAKLGTPIDDAVVAYFKRKTIKKYRHALRRAQRATESFIDGCGEGRFVKPTVEGLEVLGRVLIRVEKARLYFNYQ